MLMRVLDQTTHEDRKELDNWIESRTGVYCDDAIARGLISYTEFEEMVQKMLQRKKKKEVVPMIV